MEGRAIEPVVIEGHGVRLEPLAISHVDGLVEVWRADPAVFAYFPPPFGPEVGTPVGAEGISRYVRMRMEDVSMTCFGVVVGGAVVGATCYFDASIRHKRVEIGGTLYHPRVRGTFVNPACKLLLMEHAFERLGINRVQLKTDGRNVASQAAIAKLGAVREGVLRQHMVMGDGYVRDTVMFSVTRGEWPGVRGGLLARLERQAR
jgi:N-acetyltransferase